MKLSFWVYFFLFSVNQAAFGASLSDLRVAIPAGLAPPLLMEKNGKMEGLIVDYTNAIAEKLGRKASYSVVTRYRLDGYLLSGKVDLLCYTSKIWDANRDFLEFSKTLFVKREIIVGPAPLPKKLNGFEGQTIGTILQYVYPLLDPYFESGKMKREDNVSEEANLKKLLNGRIQYLVTDQIFLDYFRMLHPNISKNREAFSLQEYPILCSIGRQSSVKKKDLDKAVVELKASGKMKSFFDKYGGTYIE
ncbi:substrate-binding periplasmic protein [Bdellovibrio sp. GT3]|uniref:substrate-binding periplasmic protein n=1 Tax=Bdellovibrio sp. GT3 TaxID=3136282 RepID=UPI0030F4A90C